MLPPNIHQEAMSRAHVFAVAAQAGASISRPDFDTGIDFTLVQVGREGTRFHESGVKFDIQMKSIRQDGDIATDFGYDLEVGAYDTLRDETAVPRLLLFVVLPSDSTRWSARTRSGLLLRGRCFWLSLRGWPAVPNRRSVRVKIPTANAFTARALIDLFARSERGDFR